jgi:hypothetical protein
LAPPCYKRERHKGGRVGISGKYTLFTGALLKRVVFSVGVLATTEAREVQGEQITQMSQTQNISTRRARPKNCDSL